ncbi:hypothetical protein D1BOALGB6SA_7363 [Olavius sp. associated proteobacterium Delta 1]|nr:hypothetical protein D1BOALGB6SA_7363 [Olavius sp. associated proteobacterium Delta 1]
MFSAAAGLKSGQLNQKRNLGIIDSYQGGCRRSNLILFVLVLVNQNFIEDEYQDDDEVRTRRHCI